MMLEQHNEMNLDLYIILYKNLLKVGCKPKCKSTIKTIELLDKNIKENLHDFWFRDFFSHNKSCVCVS